MLSSGINGTWYFSLLLWRNQTVWESYLPWNTSLYLHEPSFELQCLRIDNCMKLLFCPQTPAFLLWRCRIEDANGDWEHFCKSVSVHGLPLCSKSERKYFYLVWVGKSKHYCIIASRLGWGTCLGPRWPWAGGVWRRWRDKGGLARKVS